jgi:hypothetical protein
MTEPDTNDFLQLNGIINSSSQGTSSRYQDADLDDNMNDLDVGTLGTFSSGILSNDGTNRHRNQDRHAPTGSRSNVVRRDTSMPSAVVIDGSTVVSESTFTPSLSGNCSAPSWNPIAKLNEHYHQHQRSVMIPTIKRNFVCWPQGPSNSLRWTSVFVCPLSGECFPSGTLSSDNAVQGIWYATKRIAEKAAAGRAMDCFRFRHDLHEGSILAAPEGYYCVDRPYEQALSGHRKLEIPPHVPPDERQEVIKLQNAATGGALF